METEPDGSAVARTLVRLLPGARRHARSDRHGHAPWYIVRSDDKKRARFNCISQLLKLIPYEEAPKHKVKLAKRSTKGAYDDEATLVNRRFVPEKY